VTAEAQILHELKLLREDLAKFKQSVYKQDKEQEQWVTADILKKMFGVDRRKLAQLRTQQAIRFRVIRPGVVRYLLSSAESFFKQAS
jgi:hypothetical protein